MISVFSNYIGTPTPTSVPECSSNINWSFWDTNQILDRVGKFYVNNDPSNPQIATVTVSSNLPSNYFNNVPNTPYPFLNCPKNSQNTGAIGLDVHFHPVITQSYTFTFSQQVTNPVLAIYSLGAPNLVGTATFSENLRIKCNTPALQIPVPLTQSGPNIVQGAESFGVIVFEGTHTTISVDVLQAAAVNFVWGICIPISPSQTPTSVTPTQTPTNTLTPTNTNTPTPTSATPTQTPTNTLTPTNTNTPTPTSATPTQTPTNTMTPTVTTPTLVTLTIGNVSGSIGQIIEVPLSIQMVGSTSVGAISIAIDYDSSKLSGDTQNMISNLNSNFAGSMVTNFAIFSGLQPNPPFNSTTRLQFRTGWFNINPVNYTGLLFNIKFKILSTGFHDVKFDVHTPGICEIADGLAQVIPTTFINGSVTVDC